MLTFVMLIALMCSNTLRRRHPWNLVALFCFTAVMSVLVGAICAYGDVQVGRRLANYIALHYTVLQDYNVHGASGLMGRNACAAPALPCSSLPICWPGCGAFRMLC